MLALQFVPSLQLRRRLRSVAHACMDKDGYHRLSMLQVVQCTRAILLKVYPFPRCTLLLHPVT